jgi:alpha-ketoglutarate-dependent taurine dioxygenase
VRALAEADETVLDLANKLGAYEAAEALRRAGVAPDIDVARIRLWAQLPQEEFIVKEEKLGSLAQERILQNLERFGICLIRPIGHEANIPVVQNLITMIGVATDWQNEAKGPIKDIRPKEGIDPNTGDSKGDLGFHVDGTQQVEQPPILLFQYATGATLGANSRFADAAKIIRDIPEPRRTDIFLNLSQPDAAVFTKGRGHYEGPIISVSATNAVKCRIRFDEVISVKAACREDFELLKSKFNDPFYPTVFQPLDGDVVVFDNWRVMHTRDEVYGTRQRHHRRVWFANLKLEHQAKYYLGIRPVPPTVLADIQRINEGR